MIHVLLTPNELESAAFAGVSRRMSHVRNPNPSMEKNANGKFKWDYDIEAAAAEKAWCKYYGIYWTGLSEIAAKDGGIVEIRWVSDPTYGLINYPRDDDETFYVLVDGNLLQKRIFGCQRAKYGKIPERWDARNGYYLTPRDEIKTKLYPKPSNGQAAILPFDEIAIPIPSENQ